MRIQWLRNRKKKQDQLFRKEHMTGIKISLMAIVSFVTIMDTRLRVALNFQEKYMNIMGMRSLDMDMEKVWM